MKKILYFAIFLVVFLIQNTATAQVKEGVEYMSQGEQNAFYFDIESSNGKGIIKLWKKYFKDYGKMKKNRKEKEWVTKEPVRIPENGAVDYDVYFKLVEKSDILTAYLWTTDGDSFLSTDGNSDEAAKIKLMFEGFARQTEIFVVEEILEIEERSLETFEKDLSKLEKKNTKYHKNIEDAKQEIIKWEEDIKQNLSDQEKTNEDINDQRKRVQKVKDNLNSLR